MKGIEESYPLSPMQQGMLLHTLLAPRSGVYIQQLVCSLHENLDTVAFRKAWERVVEQHAVLRTSFSLEGVSEPLQEVHKDIPLWVRFSRRPSNLTDFLGQPAKWNTALRDSQQPCRNSHSHLPTYSSYLLSGFIERSTAMACHLLKNTAYHVPPIPPFS